MTKEIRSSKVERVRLGRPGAAEVSSAAGDWTFSARNGVVNPSSRSVAGQRPGPYQPGARPQASVQNQPPSANGADQSPKSLSTGCSFHILPANHFPSLNRLAIEARFQRFNIRRPSAQPAGLGWYEGRLWRSTMRWRRNGRPDDYTGNVQSPLRTGTVRGPLVAVSRGALCLLSCIFCFAVSPSV